MDLLSHRIERGSPILIKKIALLLLIITTLSAIPPELQKFPYAIYPTSPEYNTARFNYNKRFVCFSAGHFQPQKPTEVAHVLSSLKRHKLPFSVRSGGHCFEPGSLSSSYIIDLEKFNQDRTRYRKQRSVYRRRLPSKDVIQKLGTINYAIPTGTCPTVG